jgi:mRNA interferase RelE/StbE
MNNYDITFARSARRDLERLENRDIRRILLEIEALALQPRPTGCRKLRGEDNLWRIRVGSYRVIYSVDDQQQLVDIIAVRHRSDVYR